jgi:hypothetical protein
MVPSTLEPAGRTRIRPVQKPPALTLTVNALPRLIATSSRTRRLGLRWVIWRASDMGGTLTFEDEITVTEVCDRLIWVAPSGVA